MKRILSIITLSVAITALAQGPGGGPGPMNGPSAPVGAAVGAGGGPGGPMNVPGAPVGGGPAAPIGVPNPNPGPTVAPPVQANPALLPGAPLASPVLPPVYQPAPPLNAVQCLLDGITYWVANGLFYRARGAGYTTTVPPIGLIVPTLYNPISILWNGAPAYLSHHIVYRPTYNGEYKVVGYMN